MIRDFEACGRFSDCGRNCRVCSDGKEPQRKQCDYERVHLIARAAIIVYDNKLHYVDIKVPNVVDSSGIHRHVARAPRKELHYIPCEAKGTLKQISFSVVIVLDPLLTKRSLMQIHRNREG